MLYYAVVKRRPAMELQRESIPITTIHGYYHVPAIDGTVLWYLSPTWENPRRTGEDTYVSMPWRAHPTKHFMLDHGFLTLLGTTTSWSCTGSTDEWDVRHIVNTMGSSTGNLIRLATHEPRRGFQSGTSRTCQHANKHGAWCLMLPAPAIAK